MRVQVPPLALITHHYMKSSLSRLARRFETVLQKKANSMKVVKVFHADHGVSDELIQWAVNEIQPTGFFLRTLEIPEQFGGLDNALYGPRSGDEPIADSDVHMKQRSPDRPHSRMVKRPKRQTRLMTIIGMANPDGVTVFTAYGGPAAEREPGDVTLQTDAEKAAAAKFWSEHALSDE